MSCMNFYLYYMMRFGYAPSKIYRLARQTFEGMYDKDTILNGSIHFIDDSLRSSSNVPACRMDRRQEVLHCHRVGIFECQVTHARIFG